MPLSWFSAKATSPLQPELGGRAASVWGDGLDDESLTTLWYPCTWNDVSDDELLLYLPSLVHARDHQDQPRRTRLVAYLRDAITVRVAWVIDRILGDMRAAGGGDASADEHGRASLTAMLESEHLEQPITLRFALERAGQIQRDWVGPGRLMAHAPRRWFARRGQDGLDLLDLELIGLRALVAALAAIESEGLPAATGAVRHASHDVFASALLVTMHSGVNAAYIYPELDVHHQLFTTAGWVGWLHRGRPSLLPGCVAEYLVDLLQRPDSREEPDIATALLLHYLDEVTARARLLRYARRIIAGGRPRVIKPSGNSWSEDTAQVAELLRQFARSETSGGTLVQPPYAVQGGASPVRP